MICKYKSLRILVFLEGDAFVEGLGALTAFGDEVEADGADVFLGAEGFWVFYFLAFYLQFQCSPAFKTNTIAITQMLIDNINNTNHNSIDVDFM